MSRAFVKESDGSEAFENLPDRPVSPHPNLVTPEGLAKLEATLDQLRQEYAGAQSGGDRSSLARLSRELRYWTARRTTAQPVPAPEDNTQVHFGSTVTIERDDGRRQTYRIVGEDEADPSTGTLSYVSPLARALMGKQLGEVVHAGASEAEITGIR